MIIRKKETPTNDSLKWTKSDRKTLKVMVKEGKSLKEIGEELGRTPAAVGYQKSTMGLSEKRDKKIKVKTKEGKSVQVSASAIVDTDATPRDKAKEMTGVARQIARANGKRITMAMFFVEDL